MASTLEKSSSGSGRRRATTPLSTDPSLSKPVARRLRASCDGCYLAKVRCSKKTTPCSRCSSHGITCKYSPSQRVGKPRRLPSERRTPNSSPPGGGSGSVDSRTLDTPSDIAVNGPLFDWNFDPAITASDTHSSGHVNADSGPSFTWQQESSSILSRQAEFDDLSCSSKFAYSHHLRPSAGSLDDHVSSNDPNGGGHGIDGVQHSQWTSQPPSGLTDELNLLQGDLASLSGGSPSVAIKTPATDATGPICACSATTFEILRTLYDRSTSPQTPFDTVLAIIKDALSRVSSLLACTCIGDPTYILILAASIAKMMSWYQSICRMPSQSSSSPNTCPTTIIVGAYRLDGEDEDAVKMQVVLNELKKVDMLMVRFGERFRALQTKHESAFYRDLITFLRRNLRQVVEELQKDMRMEFADVV
ncbi:MAG: hypothetical protein Q9217_004614 [Psora testacea]